MKALNADVGLAPLSSGASANSPFTAIEIPSSPEVSAGLALVCGQRTKLTFL